MALRSDIDRLFADEDWSLTATITTTGTTPKVLTGMQEAKWELSRFPFQNPPAADITKTLTAGITVTDAVTGAMSITVPRAENAGLVSGQYYHELEMTDALGVRRKVLWGYARVMPTAIRD